jgi:hypothetical protein
MPHVNLLIMKGHFKSLSQINIVPVPIVLSIDIPTNMEPSFVSENMSFGLRTSSCTAHKKQVKNALLYHYLLQLL